MSRLRILVLAPDANPESVSVNLVCYRHAEALAKLHAVTLVSRSSNEEAIRRAHAPFQAVEGIRLRRLDPIFEWSLRRIFKNNFHSRTLTAFSYPFLLAFEWRAWQRVRTRIMAGEFDVVLRLSPIISVIPSVFPYLLRKGSVPFVIGPINGGLPWPPGFSQAENQKAWIDNLRNLYRLAPFSDSTYRRAAAIIAGSSNTFGEFSNYRDKLFFVPENAVAESLCSGTARNYTDGGKVELIFLGGLVPYKACDLALRGAASVLRSGLARFTVVGNGPERGHLEQLTKSLGVEGAVKFCGDLPHGEAMQHLRSADILVFPSVREFGGGVVFEALAVGAVPIVADFGGPGDIVHPEIGYKLSLTNENDVVLQLETILAELVRNPDLLNQLRRQGMSYARARLTWDAKAQDTTKVLRWSLQQGPKPNLLPPKALVADLGPTQ